MATLTSVNVGLPRDVPWQGRTVHTGAWKEPVTGSRMVRRLNIDGDGQGDLGGHGGVHRAVLVYQSDSYDYWAKELGRQDLTPGAFGENLTVDGLADDEVCIGDRYRIGSAVFEVSQPRVTCYRVGLRLEEPRMAALLVERRRPGFYCRVLVEGEIEAGQEIVKVGTGPERITVADVDALLYLRGHPKDDLDRALRVQALSPGWQQSLHNLRTQADRAGNTGLTAAATTPPPAWQGFRPLAVAAIETESEQVVSLSLADRDGSPLPQWLAGQSITVRLDRQRDAPLIRNYSLCNRPGDADYRIGVKLEPSGAGSSYIHNTLRVGDHVDAGAPRGTFFLTDGDEPVILCSAGVGVTPVLSMLHALAASRSVRPVWWLHSARNGAEHSFAAEARDLLTALPNARSHVAYTQPAASDHQGRDFVTAGRLSADLIASIGLPAESVAFVCGPASFMVDVDAALVRNGLSPARVHTEAFGSAGALTPGVVAATAVRPHPPRVQGGPGPSVGFARSGLSVPWNPAFGSLLDLAEACDVPVRWSCRAGVCHNCETALVSGSVSYDPDPLQPPASGNILTCCSRPTEPVVVDL